MVKKSYLTFPFFVVFYAGWRREVVYRATVDPGNARTLCDVYYYAPDGKKLRSGREVSDYRKHLEQF